MEREYRANWFWLCNAGFFFSEVKKQKLHLVLTENQLSQLQETVIVDPFARTGQMTVSLLHH